MSVTNNSSFQNYSHLDNHTGGTTDTPGFKLFTRKLRKTVIITCGVQTCLQTTGIMIVTIYKGSIAHLEHLSFMVSMLMPFFLLTRDPSVA